MNGPKPLKPQSLRFGLPPLFFYSVVVLLVLPFVALLPVFHSADQEKADCNDFLSANGGILPGYFRYQFWLTFGIAASLITATLTFIDYSVRKSVLTTIIGTVMLVTGLYDIIYIITENPLNQQLPLERFYARWFTGRLLNCVLLTVSVAYYLFATKEKKKVNHGFYLRIIIFINLACLVVAIYGSSFFESLPALKIPESFITAPYELIIIGIYAILMTTFLPHYIFNSPTLFSKIFMLSLVPAILADLFMLVHHQNFDIYFNSAHYLRFLSFILPFCGICLNYIYTSLQRRIYIQQLDAEIMQRKTTQKHLEAREKQLAISQSSLEEKISELNNSNIELERFAYVASHDMQEPLRKIRAFGEILQNSYGDELSGKGLDYLERMNRAAQRMQKMIDELLAFSRTNNKALVFSEVNLHDIIMDALTDLEYLIESTKANIHIDADVKIRAIPSQIRQLILNLVGNSLKFRSPDIKPSISIKASINSAEDLRHVYLCPEGCKECCVLQISDNGIGFDNSESGSIFKLFHRLHSKSEFEGVGMGLSIVKKITENHNGYITAQGKEGFGSTFTIFLPLSN